MIGALSGALSTGGHLGHVGQEDRRTSGGRNLAAAGRCPRPLLGLRCCWGLRPVADPRQGRPHHPRSPRIRGHIDNIRLQILPPHKSLICVLFIKPALEKHVLF